MGRAWRSKCGLMELREGHWLDVLDGVGADALIVDAPYSERTHGSEVGSEDGSDRSFLSGAYSPWSAQDVEGFVCCWSDRIKGWMVSITDHVLQRTWLRSMRSNERYDFAPVPIIERGRNVRLRGDGPACWALWMCVGRPRKKEFSTWGALPGGYVTAPERAKGVVGGKPMQLMSAIVSDYTRKGDLVVDPCAGAGTTLKAAAMQGRRAIGAEIDPATFDIAVERLSVGYTPRLF